MVTDYIKSKFLLHSFNENGWIDFTWDTGKHYPILSLMSISDWERRERSFFFFFFFLRDFLKVQDQPCWVSFFFFFNPILYKINVCLFFFYFSCYNFLNNVKWGYGVLYSCQSLGTLAWISLPYFIGCKTRSFFTNYVLSLTLFTIFQFI